ncbi:MAG: CPBP family glutamic-type intramembrane protease [Propionibacteriaceae bacterium]
MSHDPYPNQRPPQVEPDPSLAGYPPPTAPPVPTGPYGTPDPYSAPSPYGAPDPYAAPSPYAGPGAYGVQAPYGTGPYAPVPAGPAAKPSPMPDVPREYQQLLRGPRYHWWRVLVAAAVAAAIAIPLMLLAYVPVALVGLVGGVTDPLQWAGREILKVDNLGPAGFLYVNLSLIVLIPAAGLSIWVAHRIRPRFLSSVQGGIRWRWLLRCLVVVVPVWAIYLGASALVEPATSARPAQWGWLLLIVILLTPFQAAGEEYFFRGWIMQNVGSWFKHPIVSLVAGLVVSVVAFSAAHGSPNIWILGDLGVFALTAGLATWRTGGLEAGIAIHAVNNIGVFFTVILLGGWQEAFVSSSSTSTPLVFGIAVLVHAVALALILWQAKRAGIERRYLPATPPANQPPLNGYPGYPQPLMGR